MTSAIRLSRGQRWAAAALVALLALWVGWAAVQRLSERVDPVPARTLPPPTVEVLELRESPFAVSRRYTGAIEAETRALISARLTAKVTEVPHREGAHVARNTVLVRLEDTEQQREVERLQAVAERLAGEAQLARQQLAREENLYRQQMTPERAVDEARQRVQALEAQARENEAALAVMRARLSYAAERAPFDGIVQSVHVQRGELAALGRPLIELVATQPLRAVIAVPQADAAAMQPGLTVRLTIAALDQAWPAQIDRIYPALDPGSRNATVVALIAEPAAGVRPGMAVAAQIELERGAAALAVPAHALRRESDGTWVYLVDAGVVRKRAVEAGPTQAGMTWIRDGLRAGEFVITTPDPRLAEGDAVTVAGPRNPR